MTDSSTKLADGDPGAPRRTHWVFRFSVYVIACLVATLGIVWHPAEWIVAVAGFLISLGIALWSAIVNRRTAWTGLDILAALGAFASLFALTNSLSN
ncbi:hypothetical protein [Microbacterium sp. AG1240]|uniref:hypothetical protein n=1 Tax=Microbacterium sp. AG1240 TaxID=2183992 RepID=UPI0011C3C550|nr:hypothetical protein [Microbacterium sp. AG1240]